MGAPNTAELMEGMPANVVRALARRGITPTDLATAEVVRPLPSDAVLLTGSYATGEFKPTSDFDLLVLTDGRPGKRPPGATNHPSTFGDSFDVPVRGLVVNVEYVDLRRVRELCRLVADVHGGDELDLPNLQPLEVRLIQRLAVGIPLFGIDLVEELRPALEEEAVRASSAALNFVMALSLLEDTRVLPPPAREVMRRTAAEALLLSAVNAYGPITYDVKHLCSRAENLARRPDAPSVITAYKRALFVDRLAHEDGLDYLLGLAEDLHNRLSADDAPLPVAPMLRPFREQWEWAGRTFS